ncbi:multidrug resistance-associated protein 5 [Tanacetum coccineum]|uniref:Multidrug resistance-associated protein 5 n=1 Tax=Tanacetum coccineum TaxID=301880 RepID=A0ABQ4YXR8_9ASTR
MILRTDLYCFDVHNDGYFSHLPLAYVNGVNLEMAVRRMAYEQVSDDRSLSYMFDVEETFGRLNLYLDHLDMDLSEYLSQSITNEMDACIFNKIGPSKKRYCNEFSMDEMVDWAEMEVEQQGVETRTSTTDKGKDATKGVEARTSITNKGKEKVSQDATKYVKAKRSTVESDFKETKVGEKYVSVAQFKECLTFYALASGFSLWYERNCEARWMTDEKKFQCISLEDEYTCCTNAKKYTLTEYEKIVGEHYAMLRSYEKAILDSNPGSTIKLGVTINPDDKTYFDRFFLCFVGLADGWKARCRKIITLDVVNVENKDNWTWFLELLEQDLGCSRGNGLTLMSDQHKGLMETIKDAMPNAEHMQCAGHIYENFRKRYPGLEFWHVIPAGGNLFEVRSRSEGFTIDEGKRTCSCRMWQLSGIPCVHATKSMYSTVLPPKPRKMPGRPRKKRIKAIGEGGSSTRVSKPRKKQSVGDVEDVDVVLRGLVRDEGVGGFRGGAGRSRGRGGADGSRGGTGGSRGGALNTASIWQETRELDNNIKINKALEFSDGMEFEKPSRDFTRPLGPPSGLKGLLHTLNATVIPMKLYRMVMFPVMVDVAQRRRLEAWLRACCLFILLSKSRGVFHMARRRQRRGAGVSMTHDTKGESNGIQNGSTINGDTNATSPAYVTDNLHNPLLPKGRKQVRVSKGLFHNSSECSRQITRIFKERIDKAGYTWTKVSQSTKTFTLENLSLEIETNVRETWDSKASSHYTNFLRDIGDKNVKLVYMSDDAWKNFTSYWETPKYKEIHEKNTQNRLRGESSSTHTGGSISFCEHAQNLVSKKGRKISSAESQVDETTTYITTASGAKKRNLYGVGSKRVDYLKDSGNETTISKADDRWEKKSLKMEKMERKIKKLNQNLEIVCSRFNITLLNCDFDSENGDGGDAHQGPNTSHSRAVRRKEDDHDSRMIMSL